MRKVLLIILCFFAAFSATAHSGVLYSCADRDGNILLTTNPQDGMKCELKQTFKKSRAELMPEKEKTEEEVTAKEDNTTEKPEESLATRINKCISCCNNKRQACFNYLAYSQICPSEEASCIATCNSEGASSSSWSECWSKSEP
ncbi:MAG: hypothetical protein ABFD45_08640 [Smithella sp.]